MRFQIGLGSETMSCLNIQLVCFMKLLPKLSGWRRFIWPAIYLFVLYVIVKVNRKFSAKVASLVLVVCLSIQVFDSYGALQVANHRFTQKYSWNPEIDSAWKEIVINKTKLLVVSESKTYDYPNWIWVADFAAKIN